MDNFEDQFEHQYKTDKFFVRDDQDSCVKSILIGDEIQGEIDIELIYLHIYVTFNIWIEVVYFSFLVFEFSLECFLDKDILQEWRYHTLNILFYQLVIVAFLEYKFVQLIFFYTDLFELFYNSSGQKCHLKFFSFFQIKIHSSFNHIQWNDLNICKIQLMS